MRGRRGTLGWSCLTAAAGFAASLVRAADPAPLPVCIEQDNPPFAMASAAGALTGIDVDVAQALGERLRRSVRVESVVEPNRGGFGKALRQSIAAGRCALFMGVPDSREMSATLKELALDVTRPYVMAGYVYASRRGNQATGLADPRRARRIGVASATPGDLYLYAKKLNRVPYPGTAAVLQALRSGEIDLGLVWTPAVAATGTAEGWTLSNEPADDPALRTALAIGVRASDAVLRRQVDAALLELGEDGTLKQIAVRHGLHDLGGID